MSIPRWDRYPLVAHSPDAKSWLTIQANLGLSQNTIEAYGRALEDFLSFSAGRSVAPEMATRAHIATYIHDLATRKNSRQAKELTIPGAGLANATIQQRLTAIRLYYDYLMEEGTPKLQKQFNAMNGKLKKDDSTEVADEKEALRANLVKHVLDQLPNALQAALPALNAYPNDPGVLLLTVTTALIDRKPDQALRFLHRFTKTWQSLEYEDQLLRAIALAQQGHWPQAAVIGKQIGWPNLFGAFIHLPGSWALRDWAHGWVRQIERYEDRQKRSVAAKKGLERRKAGVAKLERAAEPHREEKAREPQAEETVPAEAAPETAPSAEPELSALPRYQIRIPFSVEFSDSLETSLAVRSSSDEADREAFRLRHELAHLGLLQGFDELLCLPTLRGVETYWYQLETVRKVLKQFRGRVLLADEVGLGKTIEAGMVLKEYLLRGMAERVLVLTPATLVGQWREEMAAKFEIEFDSRFPGAWLAAEQIALIRMFLNRLPDEDLPRMSLQIRRDALDAKALILGRNAFELADRFRPNPAAAFFGAFAFNHYPSGPLAMTDKIIS